MQQARVTQTMLGFVFGLCLGGFLAVTVVREAIPLRDHVWAIGLALLTGAPMITIMYMWFKSLLKKVRVVLGEKGGDVISSILTFQLVALLIIFLIVISILYAAIA
ncbi:MAG: hypothetical protein AAB354_00385 [candidate division KSB1 bacterium]